MEDDDVQRMRAWRNDPGVYQGLVERTPISSEAQERWIARVREKEARGDEIWFIIVADEGVPIGSISLSDLDRRSRHAQWAMFIGDAAYRKTGHAVDAAVTLLDFAFSHLNLRKVWCRVLASNEAALAMNRRLGFVEEGRLRQQVYEDGAYQDLHYLGLFREEFEKARGPVVEQLKTIAEAHRRRGGAAEEA